MNSQSRDYRRPRSGPASYRAELAAVALGAALAGSQAFAQQPAQPPAQRSAAATAQERASFLAEELVEAKATVTALDSAKRLISLQTDDGRDFTVEAGEDVRNFSQIEVGDEVNVQYYQSLAADVTEAEASDGEDAVVLGARAAQGERPAGGLGMLYTAIVTIDSVDTTTNTVSFTGPEGKQRETTVERPEAREFVSQLKPGDRVQLTYGEAFAIAVAPTGEERELR
jgi:hypothetical protein